MYQQEAIFLKATLTKKNPKKNDNRWCIVDVFIPEVNKQKESETAGAIVQIMSMNDTVLFELVKNCQFGDGLTLEEVHDFYGNKPVINYKIASVG